MFHFFWEGPLHELSARWVFEAASLWDSFCKLQCLLQVNGRQEATSSSSPASSLDVNIPITLALTLSIGALENSGPDAMSAFMRWSSGKMILL